MDSLVNTPRKVRQTREWAWEGRRLFISLAERLSDEAFTQPSLMPGWTRAHVMAHVANNAIALQNLAEWGCTGIEKPMYASPEQRDADIETAAALEPAALRRHVIEESQKLSRMYDELTPKQWEAQVKTSRGRTIALTQVPWMRAREVMVHSVDLDAGIRFQNLPEDFNAALIDEIVATRSAAGDGPAVLLVTHDARGVERRWNITGQGPTIAVEGPLSSGTAWLTGRPVKLLSRVDGEPLPTLGPWL